MLNQTTIRLLWKHEEKNVSKIYFSVAKRMRCVAHFTMYICQSNLWEEHILIIHILFPCSSQQLLDYWPTIKIFKSISNVTWNLISSNLEFNIHSISLCSFNSVYIPPGRFFGSGRSKYTSQNFIEMYLFLPS